MANRFRYMVLLFAALVLLAGISNATQVTLGESAGQVLFTNMGGNTVDFTYTGNCGHAACLSGFGLFGSVVGSYQMWITGGTPQLMVPDVFDVYPIDMMGSTIHFSMVLSGGQGTLTGDIGLEALSGGATFVPEFLGNFTTTGSTGLFAPAFKVGSTVDDDFSILLARTVNVDLVYKGIKHSVQGPLSSGEILSTPEPGSLALLGSGFLTLAGLVRRRLF